MNNDDLKSYVNSIKSTRSPTTAKQNTIKNTTYILTKNEMTKEDIEQKYNALLSNLIKEGYDLNSPQVQELFKSRAQELSNLYNNSSKSKTQNIDTTSSISHHDQTSFTSQPKTNQSISKKAHIIISKGHYYLLDSKTLEIIDHIYSNPITKIFKRHSKLKKFKKQLNKDLKIYKNFCKRTKKYIDKNFIEMHKRIKYYLKLCPDADYVILDLIRRNVKKLDLPYENYQSICAEYLHELAKLSFGNLNNIPFDIWYSCSDTITTNHKYIAYEFTTEKHPVDSFREIYYEQNGKTTYLDEYRCEAPTIKYNPSFNSVKHIQTNLEK